MLFSLSQLQKEIFENLQGITFVHGCPSSGKSEIIFQKWIELIKKTNKKIFIFSKKDDFYLRKIENFDEQEKTELKKRLENDLGSFSQFCKEFLIEIKVIQVNDAEFISDTRRYKLTKTLLRELNFMLPDHCLKSFFDLLTVLRSQKNIDIYKHENWFLQEKETWKKREWTSNQESLQFQSFIDLFEAYSDALNKELFDSRFIIDLFLSEIKKPENKAKLSEYGYFFVDGFEDITQIEFELIKGLLSSVKEIYLFGDPKQSVFEFYGSMKNSYETITKELEITNKFEMNEAFEISEEIIKFSNKLVNKEITTNSKEKGFVKHFTFDTLKDESSFIGKTIEEILKIKENATFGILGRIHDDVEKTVSNLKKCASALKVEKLSNLRIHKEHMRIANVLLYVWSFNVYKSWPNDTFDYNFYKLWAEQEDVKSLSKKDFEKIQQSQKEKYKTSFDIEVFDELDELGFNKEKQELGKRFYEFVVRIQAVRDIDQKIITLLENLWNAAEFKGIENKYEDISKQARGYLQKEIKSFFACIFDNSSRIKVYTHAKSFYSQKISAGWKKTAGAKTDYLICLMTMHSSKWSTFDYVFVCGLTEGNLPFSYFDMPLDKDQILEEKNLLYLSMTRAKKGVFLISSPRRDPKAPKTRFLKEMGF